jgi:uncharacterized membrane protein
VSRRFRPIYGLLLVPLFMAAVLVADLALDGGLGGKRFERVSPDRQGQVHLEVGDLEAGDVRFYRFLNSGNQEIKFFIARDRNSDLQIAFDANEICYKLKRGYTPSGDWVVCNKCDKAFRIEEINAGGGGCKPVPVKFTQVADQVVLEEGDILAGWRYFR